MYNQKLVASIKSKGKVLREFKDTVYIPFASEYSILIKNLNTVRALVNVYIDGENAVPGGLVINPSQSVDLERWIKNGNLSEGNKFKFIERTSAIENGPRGVTLEDGLIRVEYQFEIPRPVISWTTTNTGWNNGQIYPMGSTTSATYNVNGVMRGVDKGPDMAAVRAEIASYCAANNITASGAVHDGMATMDCAVPQSFKNEVGITVPGSKSTQSFSTTSIGTLELEKHNIVLKLVGDLGDNKPVTQPVTVKAKPKCVTCGKQNKAHAKFCSECGTALEIFA